MGWLKRRLDGRSHHRLPSSSKSIHILQQHEHFGYCVYGSLIEDWGWLSTLNLLTTSAFRQRRGRKGKQKGKSLRCGLWEESTLLYTGVYPVYPGRRIPSPCKLYQIIIVNFQYKLLMLFCLKQLEWLLPIMYHFANQQLASFRLT